MKPSELVIMVSLGCSPGEAIAELIRLEPALINLETPFPVGMGTVRAQTLNVRERPDVNAKRIGQLRQGDIVEVWGRSADGIWLGIGEPAGWVARDWVTVA